MFIVELTHYLPSSRLLQQAPTAQKQPLPSYLFLYPLPYSPLYHVDVPEKFRKAYRRQYYSCLFYSLLSFWCVLFFYAYTWISKLVSKLFIIGERIDKIYFSVIYLHDSILPHFSFIYFIVILSSSR